MGASNILIASLILTPALFPARSDIFVDRSIFLWETFPIATGYTRSYSLQVSYEAALYSSGANKYRANYELRGSEALI